MKAPSLDTARRVESSGGSGGGSGVTWGKLMMVISVFTVFWAVMLVGAGFIVNQSLQDQLSDRPAGATALAQALEKNSALRERASVNGGMAQAGEVGEGAQKENRKRKKKVR